MLRRLQVPVLSALCSLLRASDGLVGCCMKVAHKLFCCQAVCYSWHSCAFPIKNGLLLADTRYSRIGMAVAL